MRKPKKPNMRNINTKDYREAPGGTGPQAYNWKDKPHRLVYDLCTAVEQLRADLQDMEDVLAERDEEEQRAVYDD